MGSPTDSPSKRGEPIEPISPFGLFTPGLPCPTSRADMFATFWGHKAVGLGPEYPRTGREKGHHMNQVHQVFVAFHRDKLT